MKIFVSMMMAATILAAPMAQAQEHYGNDQGRSRSVERTVTIEKKTVVKKPRWNRGQKLTRAERARLAEVRDYKRYRLQAPPRGYQWVRIDNEFLLIGTVSGVISNIITGR